MSKLRKIANITETKGPGYENSYGQVTPYHILFKDFGNEIAELPKEQSVEFVINKLKQLNQQNGNDPEYTKMTEEEIKSLKDELLSDKYDNGMDILFAIKDKLLESEGAENAESEQPQQETTEEQPAVETPQEAPVETPAPEVAETPEVQPEVQPEPEVPQEQKQASLKRLIRKV